MMTIVQILAFLCLIKGGFGRLFVRTFWGFLDEGLLKFLVEEDFGNFEDLFAWRRRNACLKLRKSCLSGEFLGRSLKFCVFLFIHYSSSLPIDP